MKRVDLKLLISVVLLVSASAAFLSGAVLLTALHAGPGAFRTSAFGVTRLAWLNLHRLPALIAVAALGLHLALNWRPLAARLRRCLTRRRGPGDGPELVLYATFWTTAIWAMAVWALLDGSAPLAGPAPLGRPPHLRHLIIEVHHLVGIVALPMAIHHVAHRWRPMVRALRLVSVPLRRGVALCTRLAPASSKAAIEDREA